MVCYMTLFVRSSVIECCQSQVPEYKVYDLLCTVLLSDLMRVHSSAKHMVQCSASQPRPRSGSLLNLFQATNSSYVSAVGNRNISATSDPSSLHSLLMISLKQPSEIVFYHFLSERQPNKVRQRQVGCVVRVLCRIELRLRLFGCPIPT